MKIEPNSHTASGEFDSFLVLITFRSCVSLKADGVKEFLHRSDWHTRTSRQSADIRSGFHGCDHRLKNLSGQSHLEDSIPPARKRAETELKLPMT